MDAESSVTKRVRSSWHSRIEDNAGLAEGILQQQGPNGAHKIYFHDLPGQGEELYAGEAMLALMESCGQLQNSRYLSSVERGFSYYDAQYFQRGRVTADVLVFFANWQSQACRLLHEYTRNEALKRDVARYVFRMHDRIIAQGFYQNVARSPNQQVSVEVACALEGLNDAHVLACHFDNDRAERYRQCI